LLFNVRTETRPTDCPLLHGRATSTEAEAEAEAAAAAAATTITANVI